MKTKKIPPWRRPRPGSTSKTRKRPRPPRPSTLKTSKLPRPSTLKTKKRSKLRGKVKKLASKFIAEEIRTRAYPLAQARAIGISRARAEIKRQETRADLEDLLARY